MTGCNTAGYNSGLSNTAKGATAAQPLALLLEVAAIVKISLAAHLAVRQLAVLVLIFLKTADSHTAVVNSATVINE